MDTAKTARIIFKESIFPAYIGRSPLFPGTSLTIRYSKPGLPSMIIRDPNAKINEYCPTPTSPSDLAITTIKKNDSKFPVAFPKNNATTFFIILPFPTERAT